MKSRYEYEDFVVDRTQADVDEANRMRKTIAETGFNSLSLEDRFKWQNGLKACLNYSDLERLLWACAVLGYDWLEGVRNNIGVLAEDYNIDLSEFKFHDLLNYKVKITDYYDPSTESVSYTLSEFPYLNNDSYTYKDLSDDIKKVCYMQGYECNNSNNDDLTIFENLSYNELNKIEQLLSYAWNGFLNSYWDDRFERIKDSVTYTGDDAYAE